MGPPEVAHNFEQHRGRLGYGAGEGRMAPNVVQLIVNAAPREDRLKEQEEDKDSDEGKTR